MLQLKCLWTVVPGLAGLVLLMVAAAAPAADHAAQIERLLAQMTLEEKIRLVSGDETGFNAPGLERLGIPKIYMADGPVGVRVGAATAWPVSVAMAASWDVGLIERFGRALADETRAKGKTCILGPCVGIQRFPLGGRNFESLGEDPFLSSRMAVAYVRGVQSRGVIATVKHYAANDQEWERTRADSIVGERALREVHLAPFEAAVREAGAWAVMSSYNIVNGHHASENAHLLTDVLKREWGFDGVVMSDWVSVHSDAKAANAGLDIEMPRAIWFGDRLLAAMKDGRVAMSVIDDKVRRLLRVRYAMGLFGAPALKEDQSVVESGAHRALALEMAQKSITLLQNDGILPLSKGKVKKVAVIGPNGAKARTGGGGSSIVFPWRSVSPRDGLRNLLGDGVELRVAEGVSLDPFAVAPLPQELLRTPDGTQQGLLGEYFGNAKFEGAPVFTRVDAAIDFDWKAGGPDPRLGTDSFSVRWKGRFTPVQTRTYRLGTTSDDGSLLFIDGKQVADNWGNHGMATETSDVRLEAGHSYEIRVDYYEEGGDAGMRLVWDDPAARGTTEPTIAEAVAAAKDAEVAVVCVGNTHIQEAEGRDVPDFLLSGGQEELVKAVIAANPNTVVVLYGGVPFRVKDWLGSARALLAAYYPGQEGGDALAQILFGEVNPSGRLPFSYIQERAESPGFTNYKNPDLKVPYLEGVFVGYKHHEKSGVKPLFPFGHGLGYTAFGYGNLKVVRTGGWRATISVDVTNTGVRAGEEVVQLYVGQHAPSVPRPIKELRGFAKVRLAVGETKAVTFELGERAFQFYDEIGKAWKAEHDTFTFFVGASSADVRQTATQAF